MLKLLLCLPELARACPPNGLMAARPLVQSRTRVGLGRALARAGRDDRTQEAGPFVREALPLQDRGLTRSASARRRETMRATRPPAYTPARSARACPNWLRQGPRGRGSSGRPRGESPVPPVTADRSRSV